MLTRPSFIVIGAIGCASILATSHFEARELCQRVARACVNNCTTVTRGTDVPLISHSFRSQILRTRLWYWKLLAITVSTKKILGNKQWRAVNSIKPCEKWCFFHNSLCNFDDHLSNNFHIVIVCWDTPSENTGL